MRRRGRVDANHADVVDALQKIGASVDSLAPMGSGYPDLLVGFRGRSVVLEVKDGSKSPSRRRLTADEQRWFDRFRGEAYVVTSVDEAIRVVVGPSVRERFMAGDSVEALAAVHGVSKVEIESTLRRKSRTKQGGVSA